MTQLSPTQLNIIRSPTQGTNLYLGKFEPNIVFQAQINDSTITKGAKIITFDNVITGSYSNLVAGQTLYVGTTVGNNDIGKVRIRSTTSTQITVAVDDQIQYADNLYLTVRDFYEIWPVFPFSSANTGTNPSHPTVTFYKDWDIAYSDQNEKFDPVIIMGPDFAGFWDIWQYTGVYFTATGSYTVDGSTISSYAWTFPSGCSPSSSSAGTVGNVFFPAAGMYTISLTVTASNGKTATSYRHIMLLNRSIGTVGGIPDSYEGTKGQVAQQYQDIDDWEFGELTEDNINGSIAKITVRDRANEFKNGDLVIIFAEDYYEETFALPQSFGGFPGREHILFIGYVDQAETTYDFATSKTDFVLKGSASYLQNKEMFSVYISDTQGTPADWTQVKNLTIQKALIHYIRWHSTLLNVKDFRKLTTGEGDYNEDSIEFQKGEILSNITNFLNQRLLGFCSSDRQGSFYTEIDLQILLTGSRPPSVMTFVEDDWLGTPKISEIIEQPYSNILFGGVCYNPNIQAFITGVPLLSRAPGEWQTYVGKSQNISGLTLTSQSQLNNISGLYYYKANNETPELELTLANNMRNIDVYPQEFYDFNISGTVTYRGFPNWTPRRIIPRKITYKLKNFVLQSTITFEPETYGPPGDTIVIPTTVPGGDCTDCTTPPPCDCNTNPTCEGCPPPVGVGDGNTVYMATKNKVSRTRNFLAASPNWVDITSAFSGVIMDFCLDSFNPVNRAYVLTSTSLYLINDLNSSPTWILLLSLSDIDANGQYFQKIVSPITAIGVVYVAWIGEHVPGDSTKRNANLAKVLLQGPSYTFLAATTLLMEIAYNVESLGSFMDIRRIVQNFTDSEYIYFMVNAHQGFFSDPANSLLVRTKVITAEKTTLANVVNMVDFDSSYPDANATFYMYTASASTGNLYKSIDHGVSYTLVKTWTSDAGAIGFLAESYLINIATGNKQDVMICRRVGSDGIISRTTDGGNTWTDNYTFPSANPVALGRWPYNPDIAFILQYSNFGGPKGPYYSSDGGVTWTLKMGDYESTVEAFPTDGDLTHGPIMIVPLWLSY